MNTTQKAMIEAAMAKLVRDGLETVLSGHCQPCGNDKLAEMTVSLSDGVVEVRGAWLHCDYRISVEATEKEG